MAVFDAIFTPNPQIRGKWGYFGRNLTYFGAIFAIKGELWSFLATFCTFFTPNPQIRGKWGLFGRKMMVFGYFSPLFANYGAKMVVFGHFLAIIS